MNDNFVQIPDVPLGRAYKRVIDKGVQLQAVQTAHSSEQTSRNTEQLFTDYGIAPVELEGFVAGLVYTIEVEGPDAAYGMVATALATGIEYEKERDRRPEPKKHKRDVLLEHVSNPDAALNALHAAGWKVVPK